MAVLPFYGSDHPDLFAIERAAMDRGGRVIERLDELLPQGLVVDVGAGDGFTAERLDVGRRRIVALEPARAMIDASRAMTWVQGDAERMPFRDSSLDAAYATWAYFISRGFDPTPGLSELHRTVRAGGVLAIAENLGDDEFCAISPTDITADPEFWHAQGFSLETVETTFSFESDEDALRLLTFYFGDVGPKPPKHMTYRVGLFIGHSRGPS